MCVYVIYSGSFKKKRWFSSLTVESVSIQCHWTGLMLGAGPAQQSPDLQAPDLHRKEFNN